MKFGLGKLSGRQLIFLLCLVVFLVYFGSLFNGFVWDDEEQVVNNKIVQNISNLPLLFQGSTFGTGGAGLSGWYYKPLMSLSFMINFWVWGDSAFGFHLFQVVLHIVNVVLVFLILKKLFRNLKLEIRNWSQGWAFLVALVWGIHPANVEAVAYISATQEVLFSFFMLFAFLLVLKKSRYAPWASGILFFLGLLAKEAAFVGGGVILLYLLLFEREKLLKYLGVFSLSIGVYLWLRLGVAKIPFTPHGIVPIAKASLRERFLTVPWELFSYIRLVFWPRVLAVSQHLVVRGASLRNFWLPLGVDLVFLGGLLVWGLRRGGRLFWFFVLWFLGSIFLVLNIFPLDMTVAERWLYFPLIGFLGGLSLVIGEVLEEKKSLRKVFGWAMLVILVILAARTVRRNSDWQNGLRLFSHDVEYSRDAFDLENNVGVELFRIGRMDEARVHFERSVELEPEWWTNYNNLGAVYQRQGDLRAAEKYYRKAIESGDYYLAYENLAGILLGQERYMEAEEFLEEAVKRFPENEKLRGAWEWMRSKLKIEN